MTARGSGFAYRCGVCDGEPMWSLLRRGDAAASWACAEHLSAEAEDLQRDWEVSELRLTLSAKAAEVAEINWALDAIAKETKP